jgi:SAM-dependent methyltransferase
MGGAGDIRFGALSVVEAYDEKLVPVLFAPWAAQLAADPSWVWNGKTVVDLATGTGIVTQALGDVVGPHGHIVAVDINREMLQRARCRVAGLAARVSLVESPAQALALPDAMADVVVCQQSFQFFTDHEAVAREMFRVLRVGGRAHVSTWLCVEHQPFFQSIMEVLAEMGHADIAEAMRGPFDFMPTAQLVAPFEVAGFRGIEVQQQEVDMWFPDGVEQMVSTCYATPIGARLAALPSETQQRFRQRIRERFRSGQTDDGCRVRSVSNVLTCRKEET